jgi:hypothetical protein
MTKFTWKTKLNDVTFNKDREELEWTSEEMDSAVEIYKDEGLLKSEPLYAILEKGEFYAFTTLNKRFRITTTKDGITPNKEEDKDEDVT